MNSEFITLEQLTNMLSQWHGKQVTISKVEMDDYDEVFMQLEDITYQSESNHLDPYEPSFTLQLEGTGKKYTDHGQYEELPSSSYEIPLQKSALYEYDGQQFLISTERGTYKISIHR